MRQLDYIELYTIKLKFVCWQECIATTWKKNTSKTSDSIEKINIPVQVISV